MLIYYNCTKRTTIIAIIASAVAAFPVLTSCEENNNSESISVDDVTGTYNGELELAMEGMPGEPYATDIVVDKVSENTVNLTINNFQYMSFDVGDVTLSGCTLIPADNSFSLEGSGNIGFSIDFGSLGEIEVSADTRITSGTISPTLLSLEIDIDTELIGSPISLTATFNGTRPSAE